MDLSLPSLFAAGVVTFASPCVLPLIPAYLAALAGGSADSFANLRPRLIATATAFAAGLSSVFVLLGAAATVVGAKLVAHRGALLVLSGALMLIFGLRALGVFRIGWLDRDLRPGLTRVRGVGTIAGAFAFGAAFAVGWSPCVGPVLASVLTYTAAHATSPWAGAGYLAVYAAGLSAPLILIAALARSALGWVSRRRSLIPKLERATGIALIGVGVWTLSTAIPLLRPESDSVASKAECATPSSGHACALPSTDGSASDSSHESLPDLAGVGLLEFVSGECPVCVRMAPVLARAEALCEGFGAQLRRIDVREPSGRRLAAKLGVVGTPTFVFLDRNAQEQFRLIGELPLSDLESSIEQAFGLSCRAEKAPPRAAASS